MRLASLTLSVALLAACPSPAPRPLPGPTPPGPTPSDAAPAPAEEADAGPDEPAAAPRVVPFAEIEPNRTAGSLDIEAPDATLERLRAAGATRAIVVVKVCLDVTGTPSSTTLVRSSGDAELDAAVIAGIRAWRYRPYLVEGQPAPVCFAVVFKYELTP